MKGTRAAQRYAKAILDLAQEQQVAEVVNNDMETISQTITASDELQDVLASPVVKAELKKNALREIFKDAHTITLGAFDILLENSATIKNIIDPAIIGGFILRIGDLQYNASVARSLKDLKREFKTNTYISKI